LANVASGRADPDSVITGVRTLNTYSERIALDKEVWIAGGRIAAVKPAGTYQGSAPRYDGQGGIIAPGLVDPHLHIESSMVTACAYAEAALLNGTTTIFCDSHEIGNVMDVAGVEAMLEDARQAPLSIFLTVPSTVPATSPELETAGGDLTPEKIAGIFDRWPEAVAWARKWTSCRSACPMNARTPSSKPPCHADARSPAMSTAASSLPPTPLPV
jgi:adenine deaminase